MDDRTVYSSFQHTTSTEEKEKIERCGGVISKTTLFKGYRYITE